MITSGHRFGPSCGLFEPSNRTTFGSETAAHWRTPTCTRMLCEMTSRLTPDWVLSASIPFSDLQARDLEECVYWLFDSLGARDLEWRTGGSGGGVADGGRDLEVTFYVPSPDGEMEEERWWVECKGRSGTLEANAVKSAVNGTTAPADLACLVIVTNTTFSNPTRDWVKAWQATHPRPKIKLWDHTTLERQLSRHPDVVLRLFAEALSTSGQLQALRERFWNKLEYTPPNTLRQLWSEREALDIGPLERMALIANEFAHGNIEQRPWGGASEPQDLFNTLQIGFLNLPFLWVRARRNGADDAVLVRSFAYLILATLQLVAANLVAECVLKLVTKRDGKTVPRYVVEVLLVPILCQLADEMGDVCSADCDRIFGRDRWTFLRQEDPLDSYWQRLEQNGAPTDDVPQKYVMVEKTIEPCKVGFEVNDKRLCPLFQVDPTVENVAEFLAIIERVSEFRLRQARARVLKVPGESDE